MMKREDMDIKSSCTKNKFVGWDLKGRNPTVALRETGSDYQEESYKYSVSNYFGPSSFCCKEPNPMFSTQVP